MFIASMQHFYTVIGIIYVVVLIIGYITYYIWMIRQVVKVCSTKNSTQLDLNLLYLLCNSHANRTS